jgi:hypothetical protein
MVWKKIKKAAKQAKNWVGEKWNTGAKATTNIVQGVGDLAVSPFKGGANKALKKLGRGLKGGVGLPFDVLNDALGRPANKIRAAFKDPPPIKVPVGPSPQDRYNQDKNTAKTLIINLYNGYKNKQQKAIDSVINSDPTIIDYRRQLEKEKKYGTPEMVKRLENSIASVSGIILRSPKGQARLKEEFNKLPKLENEEYAKTLYTKGINYANKVQADYLQKWEQQNSLDKYKQDKNYKAQTQKIQDYVQPTYLTQAMASSLTGETPPPAPAAASFSNFKLPQIEPKQEQSAAITPSALQTEKPQAANFAMPKLAKSNFASFSMPQLKPKKQKAFSVAQPIQPQEEEDTFADQKNTINAATNKLKKFVKAW